MSPPVMGWTARLGEWWVLTVSALIQLLKMALPAHVYVLPVVHCSAWMRQTWTADLLKVRQRGDQCNQRDISFQPRSQYFPLHHRARLL